MPTTRPRLPHVRSGNQAGDAQDLIPKSFQSQVPLWDQTIDPRLLLWDSSQSDSTSTDPHSCSDSRDSHLHQAFSVTDQSQNFLLRQDPAVKHTQSFSSGRSQTKDHSDGALQVGYVESILNVFFFFFSLLLARMM